MWGGISAYKLYCNKTKERSVQRLLLSPALMQHHCHACSDLMLASVLLSSCLVDGSNVDLASHTSSSMRLSMPRTVHCGATAT